MPLSSAERDAVFAATRAAARALYISNDVIDQFLETSTPTQVAGCRAMLYLSMRKSTLRYVDDRHFDSGHADRFTRGRSRHVATAPTC